MNTLIELLIIRYINIPNNLSLPNKMSLIYGYHLTSTTLTCITKHKELVYVNCIA